MGYESRRDLEQLYYLAWVQLQSSCWLEQRRKFGLGQCFGRGYSSSSSIPYLHSKGHWPFSWRSPCSANWYETHTSRIQCFDDQLRIAKNRRHCLRCILKHEIPSTVACSQPQGLGTPFADSWHELLPRAHWGLRRCRWFGQTMRRKWWRLHLRWPVASDKDQLDWPLDLPRCWYGLRQLFPLVIKVTLKKNLLKINTSN